MLPYQQQQQPQQSQQRQQSDQNSPGNNLNGLNAFGFNNVNFGNPGNFNGGMGLNDFTALEHGMGLPLSQASPTSVLQTQGIHSPQQQQQQQQQPFSPSLANQQQQPGAAYPSQNLMMQSNGPVNSTALEAQYQQNRALYQAGGMSPNNAQTRLYQQQQAAAAVMAMNRARQHSPSSPSAPHQTNIGSPLTANSPQQPRMGVEYGNSSASPQNQMGGIQASPQLNRVIPSQTNNTSPSPYTMQSSQQQLQTQQIKPSQQDNMNMYQGDGNSPVTSGSNIQLPSHSTPQDTQMPQQGSQKSTPVSGYVNNNSSTSLQQQGQSVTENNSIQRPSGTENNTGQSPRTPNHSSSISTPGQLSGQPLGQEKDKADSISSGDGTQQKLSTNTDQHQQEQQQKTPTDQEQEPQQKLSTNQEQQQQGQPLLTYVPKTRNVETYGGVDLKYFDMFEIKPMVAQLPELGAVDIHALIMSLKSGMKMEVANALNTLTMLTVHTPIALAHCEDLLNVLLDILDQDFFGYKSSTSDSDSDMNDYTGSSPPTRRESIPDQVQVNYADLFDMSLDEMKSLIPMLEDSTSEIWTSLRERCLCILNLLRNFSFIPINMEYLANHRRFVDTLLKLLNYTRGIKEEDWDGTIAWFVGVRRMDTLDHRKSVLMIFSNIAVSLKLQDTSMARAFIRLIHDFLTNGPDTYYSLLASETLAKITVGYENQRMFAALVNSNPDVEFPWIEDIWAELTAVIRKDFFVADGRVLGNISISGLATLEMVIMGLYDIIIIVDNATFKDRLLLCDKSAPMTILRLCVTLGESGNREFSVVTRRGMELVRGLLYSGCGIRSRRSDLANRRGGSYSVLTDNRHKSDNKSADTNGLSPFAHKVLDVSSVREKLMMALMKPSTDTEMLADLVELLDLIESEHAPQ